MAKVLLSHITGNENTRNVVYGLQKGRLLHTFIVSIAIYKGTFSYKLSSLRIFRFLKKRELPSCLMRYTITYPFKEIGRQLSNKFKFKIFVHSEGAIFSTYSECQYIDKKTSQYLDNHGKEVDLVYCYEDIALNTFQKAKQLHKYTCYDLPIGYWRYSRELIADEKLKNPDWYKTIGGFNDSEEKTANKDKEIELADFIIVASSFTRKSLSLFPGELPPVYVVPYGFPPVNDKRQYSTSKNNKIKLLYVGGLSQRKGLSYMFDALKGLDAYYELTVVGGGDVDKCKSLRQSLSNHHYLPPMSHDKILKLMSESDILIFPSLFEGFGLVITEAMSQGTPVITTDRTCAPDIITDGEDGWIVNAADTMAIRVLLERLLNDKEEIIRVGKKARETARKRPWVVYQEEMVATIGKAYDLLTHNNK